MGAAHGAIVNCNKYPPKRRALGKRPPAASTQKTKRKTRPATCRSARWRAKWSAHGKAVY